MWYVIQTLGGEEEQTANMIRKQVPSYYIEDCFIPRRERMKKFHGCWHKVDEILFRDYVFVISQQPEELYQSLRHIPKLTKLLGREDGCFVSLNEEEQRLVQRLGDNKHRTQVSKIKLEEGEIAQVIDGPLKDYVGNIVKVNLHKREVVVRVVFMGREMDLKMGIEMVDAVENKDENDRKAAGRET